MKRGGDALVRPSGTGDRGPEAAARKASAGAVPSHDVTSAVPPNLEARDPAERRLGDRHRTRLRSGKLVHGDGRFLCECLVHNRSTTGRRIRVPDPTLDVPPTLFFYDDLTELVFHARIVWRKGHDLGLRLAACAPSPLHRSILGAMRRKFYILSD